MCPSVQLEGGGSGKELPTRVPDAAESARHVNIYHDISPQDIHRLKFVFWVTYRKCVASSQIWDVGRPHEAGISVPTFNFL